MIPNAKVFDLCHQRFWLLPEKGMYWQKHKTLLVADLHIGKSGHFRKNGIAVPKAVNTANLKALSEMLKKLPVEHLVILGDLFHSNINKEWEQFIRWRKKNSDIEISLVIGNHDILKKQHYHTGVINLFKKMTMGPFLFVHDLQEFDISETDKYTLSGHLHPAVKLRGKGRQTIKLPSFYFTENYGILPAMGKFTGTYVIEPKDSDHVFIIADAQVLSAQELGVDRT